ncbi:MAG: hypothetical protein EB120_10910 [Proteobacteria bacterium]|nr:hypothetical protein [Pseudomonadota bacterium]NDG27667.1 hypothetical protein [Pseudomonadota bacterium]
MNYDPLIDIAWDDETTPVNTDAEPDYMEQEPSPKEQQLHYGQLYRSEGQAWQCYICAKPTDISLPMRTYTLRIHPICAIQYKIIEPPSNK